MHIQSEKTLREIACRYLEEREDNNDAWELFRDEAIVRFNAEDDGPVDQYINEAIKIFEEEKMAAYDQAIAMTD